jgi:hypothetical protein
MIGGEIVGLVEAVMALGRLSDLNLRGRVQSRLR